MLRNSASYDIAYVKLFEVRLTCGAVRHTGTFVGIPRDDGSNQPATGRNVIVTLEKKLLALQFRTLWSGARRIDGTDAVWGKGTLGGLVLWKVDSIQSIRNIGHMRQIPGLLFVLSQHIIPKLWLEAFLRVWWCNCMFGLSRIRRWIRWRCSEITAENVSIVMVLKTLCIKVFLLWW